MRAKSRARGRQEEDMALGQSPSSKWAGVLSIEGPEGRWGLDVINWE